MNYPINDVFEGVGDLLMAHGVVKMYSNNINDGRTDVYIKYGNYKYLVVYIDGELDSIVRSKEVKHD